MTKNIYTLMDISEDGAVSLLDDVRKGAHFPSSGLAACPLCKPLRGGKAGSRYRQSCSRLGHSLQSDVWAGLIGSDGRGIVAASDQAGEPKDDMNLPSGTDDSEKLAKEMKQMFEDGKGVRVTTISAVGQEMVPHP